MEPVDFYKSNKPKFDFLSEVLPLMKQKAMDSAQSLQQAGEGATSFLSDAASALQGKFKMTQGFGNYNPALYSGITKGSKHLGTDLATPMGTQVFAPSNGTVSYGTDKNWGNYADLSMPDGTVVRFSHLSQTGKNGQVQKGQAIAKTGSTGNSTGAHLDVSVRKGGQYINPMTMDWLRNSVAGQGGGGQGGKGGDWAKGVGSSFKDIGEKIQKAFQGLLPSETIRLENPNRITQDQPPTVQQATADMVEPVNPMPKIDTDSLRKMIEVYGGKDAPILDAAQQIADRAGSYQFWRDNPELLALLPHLETSSGRNVTRPNNWTNWGINYPGNNEAFSQMNPIDVFSRMLSGIAERNSPTLERYVKFRTGQPLTDEQLLDFGSTYEPANPSYGPNLVNGRNRIRQMMNQ